MRLAYEMAYKHPADEKPDIEMIPYTAEYQNEYKTLYNKCFHEMREALDIRPYDFIQDDSYFDSGMDVVYMLVEEGVLIGAVSLEDNEVNNLFVNPLYQGFGYGRKILLWALENIHTERIILHVSSWNEKAVRLYRSVGFDITKTIIVEQDESGSQIPLAKNERYGIGIRQQSKSDNNLRY